MKKLSRNELKEIRGGNHVPPGGNPCSTGKCGPDGTYNCSIEYLDPNNEQSPAECCCGHDAYNIECQI